MGIFTKKHKSISLSEVTELLDSLRLPTSLVFTPTNLQEERKKFFDSDTYNPQFKYSVVKNNNKEVFKELDEVEEISDVDPRISDFYIDLISSKKEVDSLMNAVGDNDLFTDISLDRYVLPSAKLFRNACRVLRGNFKNYPLLISKSPVERGSLLKYGEIESVFLKTFSLLGLDGWSVAKSKNIGKNQMKVGVKRKEVLLDPEIVRSRFKLRKSLVHEVGTHVLRSFNGLNSGFEAFSKPNLEEYLDIEEGLATYNEYMAGVLTEKWLKKKAGIVFGSYIGKDLSFRSLYNVLLGCLPKYSAFDVAYRLKRGLSDTSKSGLYSKDIAYFRGFRKVKRELEKSPSLYGLLYAGKITFEQCEWVEEGLLAKPLLVPSKGMWLDIFKKNGI